MNDRTRWSRRGWLALSLVLAGCGAPHSPHPVGPEACLSFPRAVTVTRGEQSSEWNDVALDRRGRVWLAGYENGRLGVSNLEPSGDSRAVVRHLAPNGDLLADSGATFDSDGTDVAEALAFTAAGEVIAVGRTTGAFAGTNAGQFDTFVAWSETGDPARFSAWRTVQFGTERPQHPKRAALDAHGDLVIAGYDDVFVPSNFVAAWEDPFVAKLGRGRSGENGWSLHWTHAFSTPSPDVLDGLAVANDGAAFVSGSTLSGASRGMFVRKLGASGQAEWTARYSANPSDHVAAVRRAADGTLLIAGSVFGSFRGAPSFGQQDVFVARVAPNDGRVLQAWQYGSSGADWLADMTLGPDGTPYLLIETDGALAGGASAGGTDVALLKLSADGSVLASAQRGTPSDELARRLTVDACGHALAVGATASGARRDATAWFWAP